MPRAGAGVCEGQEPRGPATGGRGYEENPAVFPAIEGPLFHDVL